jgi:hypothetical protein
MAMRRRTLKQIWLDRCKRIGIPLLFGSLVVVPLQTMIILYHYQLPPAYMPGMAHLWFLGNILLYALVLAPLSHLLPEAVRVFYKKFSSKAIGGMALLLLIMLTLLAEAIVIDPHPFELYAFTLHGWVFGFIAFTGGYLMMAADEKVWLILKKSKWLLLALAFCLFAKRVYPSVIVADAVMLSLESTLWIFGLFGLANTYLNKPSLFLAKWKDAAYPVYILHMFFLHLGSVLLFPLQLPAPLSFGILLLFVLVGSLLVYEYLVRRYNWTRWLFGI